MKTKIIVDKKEWKDGCKWEPVLTAQPQEEWLNPRWFLLDPGLEWITWDEYKIDELYLYIWRPRWDSNGWVIPPIIPEKTLEKLQEYSNIIFVCFWPEESYMEGPVYNQLVEIIQQFSIPKFRCHVVLSNLAYDCWDAEYFSITNIDYWILHTLKELEKGSIAFEQGPVSSQKRHKRLINLNRKERVHRYYILSYLFANGYDKESYISNLLNEKKDLPYPYYGVERQDVKDIYKQWWPVMELDRTAKTAIDDIVDIELSFTGDSYVHLVNETSFDTNVSGEKLEETSLLFVTEKTYKPILFKQLFLVVANPGTLRHLHRMGIQTFPELFDESYDDEYDPIKRMRKIEKNIDRVFNMPFNELHQWYLHYIPRIESNFDTLTDLDNFHKTTKKQLNYLISNIINRFDG